MSWNRLISIVVAVLVAGVMLYLLSGGTRPTEQVPRALLLDVRLERLVRVGPREGAALPEQPTLIQALCELRFLCREGRPTSVVLPSGREAGYGLAFVPHVRRRGADLEFRAEALSAELTIHWPDELEGGPADDVVLYHSREGATLVAKVGDGVAIESPKGERAVKHVRAEVQYRVILSCEGPIEEARLEQTGLSTFKVAGEELHLTNTAVPALMAVGVRLEEPTPVRDQP